MGQKTEFTTRQARDINVALVAKPNRKQEYEVSKIIEAINGLPENLKLNSMQVAELTGMSNSTVSTLNRKLNSNHVVGTQIKLDKFQINDLYTLYLRNKKTVSPKYVTKSEYNELYERITVMEAIVDELLVTKVFA